MLEQFLKWPKLVFSAVYEKIAAQANKTNTSFKSYLGNDANIEYISSVVYEGIPFFLKFGLKPESFNTKFKKHITAFRDKMYSYDDEINAEKNLKTEMPLPQGWTEVKEVFKDIDTQIQNTDTKVEETKIEAVAPTESEETTRAKLLKEWKETQEIIWERAKSSNNPEELEKMKTFTSDMSKEEMREQFYKMVAEARARVNAPEKKKAVKVKRVKTDSQKAAEEAQNIIMERAQSIPKDPKDMSTWTRVSADMSREEVIAKVLGVSIEEAKRLDKENPEVTSLKKAKSASKPKATTKKVAAKTTRKKKVEE
jgi:hypothetical protein